MSLQTIFRWENGQRSPRAEDLTKLANALGVSPAKLLSGETDTPERAAPPAPEPEPVKVETQTQTRDRGELFFRFPDGGELRLPDTPENKVMFREIVTQRLNASAKGREC